MKAVYALFHNPPAGPMAKLLSHNVMAITGDRKNA